MNIENQIVPGITITSEGLATVSDSVADVLFDLAIQLEEPTKLPVDIEHVLAAILLLSRQGKLDSNKALSSDDSTLVENLIELSRNGRE